jgi:hypothetical protein
MILWLYMIPKRYTRTLLPLVWTNYKKTKFNPPHEDNEQINFLELFLIQKTSKIGTNIFRIPINTDTTISFFSNHTTEHKTAPYRYYITRIHSFPLTPERKQKEWSVLQYITQSNNFPHTLIQKLNSHLQHKHNYERNNNNVRDIKAWTTFTSYSPLIRKITSLLKHTNVGISFKSTNTIQDLTKPKTNSNI